MKSGEPYITTHYGTTELSKNEPLNLSLVIGNQLFAYAVFNHDFTRILQISSTHINKPSVNLARELDFLIQTNQLNKTSYKHVYVAVLNKTFSLVPSAFASAELNKSLLEFSTANDPVKSAFSLRVKDISFSYTIDPEVLNLIEKAFKNATVRHAGALCIDLLFSNASLKNAELLLNFHGGTFELAARRDNSLIYYNQFQTETHEDVLYYLLFMMEQYDFNPLTCNLVVAGDISAEDGLFRSIKKYVKNVSLAVNDKSFSSSFIDFKIPDHYFFTLSNQHLCEL